MSQTTGHLLVVISEMSELSEVTVAGTSHEVAGANLLHNYSSVREFTEKILFLFYWSAVTLDTL